MPVLVGDIALSTSSAPGGIRLPTTGYVEGGFPIVNVSQKAVVLHDRLAVAWAGSHVAASTLLRDLSGLSEANVENVRRCVVEQEPSRATDNLELLGCVVEGDQPFPFAVHGREFEQIEYGDAGRFVGSGEATLREAFMQATQEIRVEDPRQPLERPERSAAEVASFALQLCGHMMSRDVAIPDDLLRYFGGGYEAVIWWGDRFQKLDGCVHMFLEADVRGEACALRGLRIVRPRYLGRVLIVIGANLVSPVQGTLAAVDEEPYVILPPCMRPDEVSQEEVRSVPRSFGTPYVMWHTFVLNEGKWIGLTMHRLFGGIESPVKVVDEDGGTRIRVAAQVRPRLCDEARGAVRRGPPKRSGSNPA